MIHDKYLIPGGTMIIDFPTGEIPALTTLYAIGSPSPPLYTLAVVNCSNGEIFVLLISNWPWPESLKTKSVYKNAVYFSLFEWLIEVHWNENALVSGVREEIRRDALISASQLKLQCQRCNTSERFITFWGRGLSRNCSGLSEVVQWTDLKYRRYRTKWRQQWFLITVCPDSWTW